MPYDFNQSEDDENLDPTDGLDDTPPTKEDSAPSSLEIEAAAVVSEVNDEVDNQLSEVEKRLERAQYYNLILKEDLFDDDSESGKAVIEELREFIRGRLGVLLGLKHEPRKEVPKPPPFDEDEIQALKAMAARVLKKPAILAPKPEPTKTAAPPTLKKVEVSFQPKVASRSTPAPALNPRTQSKVIPKAVVTGKQKAKIGSKYKTKADLPPALQEDPAVEVIGGKVFRTVVTEDGKEIRMNITPQARPTATGVKPLPMATPEQQNQVNAMHAAETIQKQSGRIAQAIQITTQGRTES